MSRSKNIAPFAMDLIVEDASDGRWDIHKDQLLLKRGL